MLNCKNDFFQLRYKPILRTGRALVEDQMNEQMKTFFYLTKFKSKNFVKPKTPLSQYNQQIGCYYGFPNN